MSVSVHEPALEVTNLAVQVEHQRILDDISFTVPTGSITAIIGPNGAGKSILLKTILGLIPKTSGTIRIFGTNHLPYHKLARLVSYIPQRFTVDHSFPLTIRNLFTLKSRHVLGFSKHDEERMDQLLTLVGMRHALHQRLCTLSGGQLQRVLLAYGLMDQPRLLLLDEPSAGIDIQGQDTMYALLGRLQALSQVTIVLVSHELDIVMRHATQVLCLNKKLLCAGVPREVLSPDVLEAMYTMPVGHFTHHHNDHA